MGFIAKVSHKRKSLDIVVLNNKLQNKWGEKYTTETPLITSEK